MPKFTELPGASPPGPPPGLCPGPAGGLTAPPRRFFGPYGRATTKMLPTGLFFAVFKVWLFSKMGRQTSHQSSQAGCFSQCLKGTTIK